MQHQTICRSFLDKTGSNIPGMPSIDNMTSFEKDVNKLKVEKQRERRRTITALTNGETADNSCEAYRTSAAQAYIASLLASPPKNKIPNDNIFTIDVKPSSPAIPPISNVQRRSSVNICNATHAIETFKINEANKDGSNGRQELLSVDKLAQPYRHRAQSIPTILPCHLVDPLFGNKSKYCCRYCNDNISGKNRCLHPYWPDLIMCESCSKSIPRCFACERKARPFSALDGTVYEPFKLDGDVFVCGICVSVNVIMGQEQIINIRKEVLMFYRDHLGLFFTEEMLRHHERSKGTQNLFAETNPGHRCSIPETDSRVLQTQVSIKNMQMPVERTTTNILIKNKKPCALIKSSSKTKGIAVSSATEMLSKCNEVAAPSHDSKILNRSAILVSSVHKPSRGSPVINNGVCKKRDEKAAFQRTGTQFTLKQKSIDKSNFKDPAEKIVVIPTTLPKLNADTRFYTKFGQCDMRKLRTKTTEMRVVDQVYIVKGLPEVLFAANLCHELLHAYFFLNYYPDMCPQVEEGVCNAVSVMYLNYKMDLIESEILSYSNCESNQELRHIEALLKELDICDFYVRKFYRNEHPHYGDGFRKAIKCIQLNGFLATLLNIQKTGTIGNGISGV